MSPAPEHAEEAARLACLRSLNVLDSPPEGAFDDIVKLARDLSGCPVALVTLVDECRQWFKARAGLQIEETPRDQSFCAYTLLADEPLIVGDARLDERFAESPFVTGEFGLRAYLGIPLVVGGFPVGSLCVIDTAPREFDSKLVESLAALGRQTCALLEARSNVARAEQAERRFPAFMGNAPAIAYLKDGDGRMRYVNPRFEQAFGYTAGELLGTLDSDWLPEAVAEEVVRNDTIVRDSGEPIEALEHVTTADGKESHWSSLKFPVEIDGETWVGGMSVDVTELRAAKRAARSALAFTETVLDTVGALVCVIDPEGRFVRFNSECERVTGWRSEEVVGRLFWDVMHAEGDRALIAATYAGLRPRNFPLRYESRWRVKEGGARLIEWHSTAHLDSEGRTEFVVGTGLDVTESRARQRLIRAQKAELQKANDRLRLLASTDGLTGALNRRAFDVRIAEELARAERTSNPLSLLLVDVDLFKGFNDRFGHQAGDEVLRGVAETLVRSVEKQGVVARYGGEEFAVLLPETGAAGAIGIAERLRSAVEKWRKGGWQVTASFGASTLRPHLSAETMVREADLALYASKIAGRNRVTHARYLTAAAA